MRILLCLFVLTFLMGCQQQSDPIPTAKLADTQVAPVVSANDLASLSLPPEAQKTDRQLGQEQLEQEKANAEKLRERYAAEIKESINSFSEFRPSQFLEVAELKVLSGGKAESGDYLFICEPKVVWLESHSKLKDLYRQATKKFYSSYYGSSSSSSSSYIQKMAWLTVSDFKVGDVLSKTKIRVRAERAGGSLIVTSVEPRGFMTGSDLFVPWSPEKASLLNNLNAIEYHLNEKQLENENHLNEVEKK